MGVITNLIFSIGIMLLLIFLFSPEEAATIYAQSMSLFLDLIQVCFSIIIITIATIIFLFHSFLDSIVFFTDLNPEAVIVLQAQALNDLDGLILGFKRFLELIVDNFEALLGIDIIYGSEVLPEQSITILIGNLDIIWNFRIVSPVLDPIFEGIGKAVDAIVESIDDVVVYLGESVYDVTEYFAVSVDTAGSYVANNFNTAWRYLAKGDVLGATVTVADAAVYTAVTAVDAGIYTAVTVADDAIYTTVTAVDTGIEATVLVADGILKGVANFFGGLFG